MLGQSAPAKTIGYESELCRQKINQIIVCMSRFLLTFAFGLVTLAKSLPNAIINGNSKVYFIRGAI